MATVGANALADDILARLPRQILHDSEAVQVVKDSGLAPKLHFTEETLAVQLQLIKELARVRKLQGQRQSRCTAKRL